MSGMTKTLASLAVVHDRMAQSHPKLASGQVWCTRCGHTQRVNTPGALRHGWPKCCGYTMTIDSPEERSALGLPPTTGVGE